MSPRRASPEAERDAPIDRARPPQWRCPECERLFGRPSQSHECRPALAFEAFLARQPSHHHPIYRALLGQLRELGDVDVDPVDVGIMVKRARTFCELRPKRNGVELAFKLGERLSHPRLRRVLQYSAGRYAHFVLLTSLDEVDEEIADWLEASYRQST